MSGPFKLKYKNSAFPFKSPFKYPRGTRMTDPPQEHYHEDGEVKWRTVSKKTKGGVERREPDRPLPPGVDIKDFFKPL